MIYWDEHLIEGMIMKDNMIEWAEGMQVFTPSVEDDIVINDYRNDYEYIVPTIEEEAELVDVSVYWSDLAILDMMYGD